MHFWSIFSLEKQGFFAKFLKNPLKNAFFKIKKQKNDKKLFFAKKHLFYAYFPNFVVLSDINIFEKNGLFLQRKFWKYEIKKNNILGT